MRTPLGEEDSVIGSEIRSLRAPGFVGAEAAVQKEDRGALALDLVPRLDARKFDVLAHVSPPSIAAQTSHTIAYFVQLLEPLSSA
jgi:hypothetical protein